MKILAYPLSVIFYLVFGLILVIFHVIQWLAYNLGGYHAHHKAVKAMDWSIFQSTRILGTSYHFQAEKKFRKLCHSSLSATTRVCLTFHHWNGT